LVKRRTLSSAKATNAGDSLASHRATRASRAAGRWLAAAGAGAAGGARGAGRWNQRESENRAIAIHPEVVGARRAPPPIKAVPPIMTGNRIGWIFARGLRVACLDSNGWVMDG
jgi:hypothetical protein